MTTTTQPITSTSTSTSRRRRESQKQVLIPMATGSDETEVILLATTLQNFGALVVLAAVDEPSRQCGMMGGFLMTADIQIEQAHHYDWDCIVIPGGERGALIMKHTPSLVQLLKRQHQMQKLYAATGASPAQLLAPTGLAPPLATCFPSARLRKRLGNNGNNGNNEQQQTLAVDDDVVICNNVVTSQGLGGCLQLAIELGELLFDLETATQVSNQLLVDRTGKLGFQRNIHMDVKREIPYEYKEVEEEEVLHHVKMEEAESDQVVGESLETAAAMDNVKTDETESDQVVGEPSETAAAMNNMKAKETKSDQAVLGESSETAAAMGNRSVQVMDDESSPESSGNRELGKPASEVVERPKSTESLDTNMPVIEEMDKASVAAAARETIASRKAASKSTKVTAVDPSQSTSSGRFLEPPEGSESMGKKKERTQVKATGNQQAREPVSSKMANRSLEAVEICPLPPASICKRFKYNFATLRKASECQVAFRYVAPRQRRSCGAPKEVQEFIDSQGTMNGPKSKKRKSNVPPASSNRRDRSHAGKEPSRIGLGAWKPEEETLFLQGLQMYGKDYVQVAALVKTRNSIQVRSHAQYHLRMAKEAKIEAKKAPSRKRGEDSDADKVQFTAEEEKKEFMLLSQTGRDGQADSVARLPETGEAIEGPDTMNGPKSKKRKTNERPASIPVKSIPSKKRKKRKIRARRRPNNAMFRAFILPILESLGWSIRSRSNIYYYILPGKIDSFENWLNCDYFDSTDRVIKFLESDERWKNNREIQTAINSYDEALCGSTGSSPAKTKTIKMSTCPSQYASDERNARVSLLSQIGQDGQADSAARLPETGEATEGCDSVSAGESDGSSYSPGRPYASSALLPSSQRTLPKSPPRKELSPRGRKSPQLFRMLVLPALQSLGWKLTATNNNYFYIPPDEHRARTRSPEKVIQILKSDKKWKDNKELHAALNSYEEALRAADKEIVTRSAFDQLWTVLETQGWTMTCANRPSDIYLYPPGITGGKLRRDYFDSKLQVLRFLRKRTNNDVQPVGWDIVLEALAAYDASPQTTATKSENATNSRDFSSEATSRTGVPTRNRRTGQSLLEEEERKRSLSNTRAKRRSSSEILSTAVFNPSSNVSSQEKEAKKNTSSTEGTKTRSERPTSDTSQLEIAATVEPAEVHGPHDSKEEEKKESDVANNQSEKIANGSNQSNVGSVSTESSHSSDGLADTASSHTNAVAAPSEEARLTKAPVPVSPPACRPNRSLVMDVEEAHY